MKEKEKTKTAKRDGGGPKDSQHADTMPEGEPDKRQQLEQQPKPKLRRGQQSTLQHEPKPKLPPTPARWWETVQPQANSQRAPVGTTPGPAPALTAGMSMAERRLIIRRDKSVPPPNKMDQEIVSAINRVLVHQKAPPNVQIMNAKRKARGTIMPVTHQNTMAAIAVMYRNTIITAAPKGDK
jgi:hypothetical protein